MALIEQTLFATIDKVQTAIDRLKAFEEQYIRCFNKMAQNRKERGLLTMARWETGKDIYDWWVGEEKKDERQLSLLAEEEL